MCISGIAKCVGCVMVTYIVDGIIVEILTLYSLDIFSVRIPFPGVGGLVATNRNYLNAIEATLDRVKNNVND